jgi:hypothetical protein
VAATDHRLDDCPLAPVFVPDWAVGTVLTLDTRYGVGSGWPSCTSVHHPAVPCSLCGRPVWYSDRSTRSKTRRSDGVRGNVYCSPGCKADAPARLEAVQAAERREMVFAAAAEAVRVNAGRARCPWPKKRAYDTREQAEVHNAAVLASDATLQPYHCGGADGCGRWHLGHPRRDAGQAIGAIARVVS